MLAMQSWSGGWQPIPVDLGTEASDSWPTARQWPWLLAGTGLVILAAFCFYKRR